MTAEHNGRAGWKKKKKRERPKADYFTTTTRRLKNNLWRLVVYLNYVCQSGIVSPRLENITVEEEKM